MIVILTLRAHIQRWSMDRVFILVCDVCRFSVAISQIRCFSLSLWNSYCIFSLPNTHTNAQALESFIHAVAKQVNAYTNGTKTRERESEHTQSSQHSQHKLNAHTRTSNGERRTVYSHQHHSSCVVAVFDTNTLLAASHSFNSVVYKHLCRTVARKVRVIFLCSRMLHST